MQNLIKKIHDFFSLSLYPMYIGKFCNEIKYFKVSSIDFVFDLRWSYPCTEFIKKIQWKKKKKCFNLYSGHTWKRKRFQCSYVLAKNRKIVFVMDYIWGLGGEHLLKGGVI